MERIADLHRQVEALSLDLERLGIEPVARADVVVKLATALMDARGLIEQVSTQERNPLTGARST